VEIQVKARRLFQHAGHCNNQARRLLQQEGQSRFIEVWHGVANLVSSHLYQTLSLSGFTKKEAAAYALEQQKRPDCNVFATFLHKFKPGAFFLPGRAASSLSPTRTTGPVPPACQAAAAASLTTWASTRSLQTSPKTPGSMSLPPPTLSDATLPLCRAASSSAPTGPPIGPFEEFHQVHARCGWRDKYKPGAFNLPGSIFVDLWTTGSADGSWNQPVERQTRRKPPSGNAGVGWRRKNFLLSHHYLLTWRRRIYQNV
jgi:hypothetical protein